MRPIISLFRMNKRQFSLLGSASAWVNGFLRENTGLMVQKYDHCRPLEVNHYLEF